MSQKAWRWVCVMLSAPGLGLADFHAGLDAYNQGNYAVAMWEWDALAEAGDVAAQHNLGLMLSVGEGAPDCRWEKGRLRMTRRR